MLEELVLKNRSLRSFKPGEKIPYETLLHFVDTARKCGATMNRQPLKYRIVTDKNECSEITGASGWAGLLKTKLPPSGKGPAAYIVVCHDTDVIPFNPIFLKDVGIVSQTIMLLASEAGYGGCMLGSAPQDKLRAILRLPDNILPQLVLALGVPDETAVLEDAENGNVAYYRDDNNVHHAPKRRLEDILIR